MNPLDKEQPLVSVVMPTYNYGRFLSEAVHSVLGQTYSACELIVVDDGSTDDTPEVMRAFGSRVRYVRQHNAGVSAARNNGIRHARGGYISFLDSDDHWLPDKLDKQLSLLRQLPESVGLVGTRTYELLPDGGRFESAITHAGGGAIVDRRDMIMRNRMITSSVLVKRACLDRVGLFDESLRYCEDWDLWLRISAHFDVAIVDEPLVVRQQHDASATKHLEPMVQHHMLVFDRHFPREINGWRGRMFRRRAYSYILYSTGSECLGTDDATERRYVIRSLLQYPWPGHYPDRYIALARTLLGTRRWQRLRRLARGPGAGQ